MLIVNWKPDPPPPPTSPSATPNTSPIVYPSPVRDMAVTVLTPVVLDANVYTNPEPVPPMSSTSAIN